MTLNIKSSRVFTAKVTHNEISNTIIHLLGHTEIWTVGISRGNKDIEGLHLDSHKNHKNLKLAYMSKKEEVSHPIYMNKHSLQNGLGEVPQKILAQEFFLL